MGKLRDKSPKRGKGGARKVRDDVLIIHRNPSPMPEQTARYESSKQWLAQRLEEAAQMTTGEKRQADKDWEKFKKSINAGRYRKVILE